MHKYRLMLMSLVLAFASAVTLAALPPGAQRVAELAAVLQSSGVQAAFDAAGVVVDGVEFVEYDVYRVTGGTCFLIARIVNMMNNNPPGWVGPRQFEVRAGELYCG